MKKRSLISVILSVFILLFCAGCTTEETVGVDDTGDTSAKEDDLNRSLVMLGPNPMNLSDRDLASFDVLGEAKIVGMGEATHGTREFFQMKHRLFRYLVENHGFRIFVIEADVGESLYIDDYVTGKRNDLDYLMREIMHFWTWRTEEVRTFIRWMRSYNLGKPENQMIRYMGNDCQFTDRNLAWLKEYFETNSEDLYQDLLEKEEEMNELLDRLVTRAAKDLEAMNESFEELLEAMDDQKESLVSLDGEYRYHIARRLIQILSQVIRVKYVSVRTDIQENPRDQYMAENVEWIDDYFQNEEKIVIWAHNLHVQKPGYWWMGHHLNLAYRDDYQVVGFAFSMGEFTAKFINSYGIYSDTPETVSITIVPMPDTVNDLFYRAEKNNFHLNLDMIPANSPLGSWLNQSQEFLQIGAGFSGAPGLYYSDEKLKVYYDHMIYFEISHHTRQIPK